MTCRIIGPKDREKWDQFVAGSKNSPILQAYEWGELKGAFGWEPIRIAIEADGQIKAAVSVLKRKIPGFNKTIFYAPRGPVIDFTDGALLGELLAAIETEAIKHNAIVLKIDPDIDENDTAGVAALKAAGFRKAGRQIQPRATSIIDLTRDLASIMQGFEPKTRYNIRLAEKKGVAVREESNSDGVARFYALHRETSRRDNFLVHNLTYYKKLEELLCPRGMAKIFTAYYEGEPIAAVFIFCFGSKVWYMFGASSAKYRAVMPNHALHYTVIGWAKAHGFSTYDLWGIPAEPKEGHPLYGVYRFKKGFNGQIVKLVGVYDLPYRKLWYMLFDRGVIWRQNLRSLLTKGKISDSLGE